MKKTMTSLFLCAIALGGAQVANAQTGTPPAVNAPIPANYLTDDPDDLDVLGIYGETYGQSVALTVPSWGQTAKWRYEETDDGHEVALIQNLGGPVVLGQPGAGWLPVALASPREIKRYSYVHLDIYCNEETEFRFGFHSNYPANAEEYFPTIAKGVMTPGQWYSIDYPLAEFLANPAWNNANANLLRFGNEDGHTYSNEIYVTNIFVYNLPASDLKDIQPSTFKVYIGRNDQLYITSGQAVERLTIYSVSGQKVAEYKQVGEKTDLSALRSGAYIVSAQLADGSIVNNKVIK